MGRFSNLHQRNFNERFPWQVYNNKLACFDESLLKDGSVSINHWDIQNLATEMFKFKMMSSETVTHTFLQQKQTQYNSQWLQNSFNTNFVSRTRTYFFLGSKISNSLPTELKQLESLKSFKEQIRAQKLESYPCRLCKTNGAVLVSAFFKYHQSGNYTCVHRSVI